VLIKVI